MAFPVFALFFFLNFLTASSAKLSLNFHHRFSDEVRRWSESRSYHLPGGWPEKHSGDYYAALADHDRRRLMDSGHLTFFDGNVTFRFNSLGFLHYALVTLGSPNMTFLVALDTGSDLFWVPCDCTSCAPTQSGNNGFDFDFSIYSPTKSSTSKSVPCSSSICEHQERCSSSGNNECLYNVNYVSADTSSSGFLVEDLLYLTTEDTINPKTVQTRIVFGCGQTQTGSFLDAAAPNGLLGLGMEKVSVPSILSSSGITANSFSMCFGRDGIGRISFGDIGSSDQQETPFHVKQPHPIYNISITGIRVGNSSAKEDFSALVDSGTSFTYLSDPAYTSISNGFNSQVRDKRITADPNSDIPFENCFLISSNESLNQLPELGLITESRGQFPIVDPIIIFKLAPQVSAYCLGIIKSDQLNIIGQNFLTGLRVVFDRERMVLGWKKFDCYDVDDSSPLPVNPINPRKGAAPTSSYTPEATKEKRNNGTSGVTVLTPSSANSAFSPMNSFLVTILMLFLLSLALF